MATHVTGGWKPYTIYTVKDVPYDTFPTYRDGGPSTVTHDGWCVSITTGGEPDAVSGVFKVISEQPWRTERHELDRVGFPTYEAAKRAQYEAGVIAFMVYDDSEWADTVTRWAVTLHYTDPGLGDESASSEKTLHFYAAGQDAAQARADEIARRAGAEDYDLEPAPLA